MLVPHPRRWPVRPCLRATAASAVLLLSLVCGAAAHSQALPLPTAATDTSGLHVVGNQIRNAAAQPVQLRGVTFSSTARDCLHPEWGRLHEGPSAEGLASLLHRWHSNAVRLLLNEDCWLGLHGAPVPPALYQQDVSQLVAVLTQQNIAVLLSLTFVAPDDTPDAVLAGSGGRQWPMPVWPYSGRFWDSVARRFQGNSRVLFDLYNEPAPDNDQALGATGATPAAWETWRNGGWLPANRDYWPYRTEGMQALDAQVRHTGAQNIVVVSGVIWASDLSQYEAYALDDPTGQLVLGKHLYNDGLACQDLACFSDTLVPLLADHPLLITELAQRDCQQDFIDQVLQFFDDPAHQAGYLAHDFTPGDCSGPALISDWDGTPTAGYGAGYQAHLRSRDATQTPTGAVP